MTTSERIGKKKRRPPETPPFLKSTREGLVTDADVKAWLRSRDNEGIEELLDAGYAAEVVALAEEALGLVEEAVESCDDPDGYLGGILENLQDLHLQACRKARPEPEALADRLFHVEMESGLDVFHGAAETYAGVLGPVGLACVAAEGPRPDSRAD